MDQLKTAEEVPCLAAKGERKKNLFLQHPSPRKRNEREEHTKGTRLSNNGCHKSYTSLLRTA